eukprot:402247-Pleurochrysis_carterae.AAC.1
MRTSIFNSVRDAARSMSCMHECNCACRLRSTIYCRVLQYIICACCKLGYGPHVRSSRQGSSARISRTGRPRTWETRQSYA